ncbi:MAG: DUF4417 domain-containing protein [Solobacterium sp.]|nr:DUF4417 domain-containing protein [Solobacterium sp.]
MKKKNELNIEYLPLEALKPYEGNVKKHPQSQIEQIKQSILDYGFNDPIAIDENGVIIEGHGRYEASKQLGLEKVPTICLSNMTEEQRKAYTIIHNKLTMSTGFDIKALKKEMQNIGKLDFKKFGLDTKFMKDHDFKAKTQESVSNILNLAYAQFEGVGHYDIPEIAPVTELPEGIEEWIGFNYVLSDKNPENKAVHFFVDDYQFERIWNRPNDYIEKLKQYKCVLSPDFSPYGDMPLATQIYNHYRKHWCAAYWQKHGITVIPTIRSSTDKRSLSFYLDGEPKKGIVAYSTMWSGKTEAYMLESFKAEWNKMVNTLHPKMVLVYGNIIPFMRNSIKENKIEIIQIQKFSEKRWNKEKGG